MARVADERVFIYRVDAQNRIMFVNHAWLDFAQENKAPELIAERVLGRELDAFIADWETRHLYEIIYERVRQAGRTFYLPLRCDSPTRRRYLRMEISPLPLAGMEFSVRVERMEERSPILLLDDSVEHSKEFVVICSWCKKIEVGAGRWAEIEDATEKAEIFGAAPPSLTHTACPDCLATIRRQLGDG